MTQLDIDGLTVHFGTRRRPIVAVDNVDLSVRSGSVVGLVGESGSGKSTIARAIVGLVPRAAGRVLISGTEVGGRVRPPVQMIFQDPYSSLDPRMTIGETLAEAVAPRRRIGRATHRGRVTDLLELVSLDPSTCSQFPRELSGGQRQRVAIARALAAEPQVLIADEITSALDASVQGAVLNLVRDVQRRLNLTMLFISHNLAVVRYLSDAIAVMHRGQMVEVGSAEQVIARPQHPYTKSLIAAVPRLGGSLIDDQAEPQAASHSGVK